MKLNYRLATDKDLDLLSEWNHQLIRDEGHRNRMTVSELRERMRAWIKGEYNAVIFGTDGKLVAYALYRENDEEVYLQQLFVVRDHRRQGIGRKAVEILQGHVWSSTKRLTVEVLTANTDGVNFWRSVGYRDYCLTLEMLPKKENVEQSAPSDS